MKLKELGSIEFDKEEPIEGVKVIIIRNELYQLHRRDGPAVIRNDGDKFWWVENNFKRSERL